MRVIPLAALLLSGATTCFAAPPQPEVGAIRYLVSDEFRWPIEEKDSWSASVSGNLSCPEGSKGCFYEFDACHAVRVASVDGYPEFLVITIKEFPRGISIAGEWWQLLSPTLQECRQQMTRVAQVVEPWEPAAASAARGGAPIPAGYLISEPKLLPQRPQKKQATIPKVSPLPPSDLHVGNGKWREESETSRIDDSTNIFLFLDSEDLVIIGYHKLTPTLVVRCKENETSVYITFGVFLGDDETNVLTRFDKEPARTTSWNISTDYEAIFVSKWHPVEFAKVLMAHQNLLVQLTPYGESPVMASFDLRGLDGVIPPLQAACHWK